MYGSDSGSSSVDGDQLFDIVTKDAKLAEIYSDLYLMKAPPRISIQTRMDWLHETMNTPGAAADPGLKYTYGEST